MPLNGYFEKVAEAAQFLRKEGCVAPRLALVLSGGLNFPVEDLKECAIVKGRQIPNFPLAKAEGHSGVLIFGKWDNFPIVVLKGRYHYYEGHSPQDVVFPYFVLSQLGAKFLVTTNAVGGILRSQPSAIANTRLSDARKQNFARATRLSSTSRRMLRCRCLKMTNIVRLSAFVQMRGAEHTRAL